MQITPDRQLLAAAGKTFCCILKKGRLKLCLCCLVSQDKYFFFFISNEQKDRRYSGSEWQDCEENNNFSVSIFQTALFHECNYYHE